MATWRPRSWRAFTLAAVAVAAAPQVLPGQDSEHGSMLGIRGIGAFGLHAGYARVERGIDAADLSASLDLGHFNSRRVRLAADVSFLRSMPYREFVVAEDASYRDVIYDLSSLLNLGILLRDPSRRVVPFVSFGVGVHVLTSSFGSIPIDLRYNTNVFGLRAASGVRIRAGGSGRHALMLEGSASLAKEVSRGGLRIGTEWLFGDLIGR